MKAKEELSEGVANQDATEISRTDSPNNKDIAALAKKVSLRNPASKYFGFSLLLAYHYVMWFIPESFYQTNLLSFGVTTAWIANLLGTVVAMVIFALMLGRDKHLLTHRLARCGTPIVLCILTLTMQYGCHIFNSDTPLYMLSFAAGALEGLMWIMWGERLIKSRAKFSVIHIGAMFGCTLFATMFLAVFLPDIVVPIFVTSLLLLSAGFLLSQTHVAFADFAPLLPKKSISGAMRSIVMVSSINCIVSIACYFLLAIIPWEELPTQIHSFTFGVFTAAVFILLLAVLCSLTKEKASIYKVFPIYIVLTIAAFCLFLSASVFMLPSFLLALCISSLLEISLIMYFGTLTQRGFFAPATAFAFSVVSTRLGILSGNSLAIFYETTPSIDQVWINNTSLIFIVVLAIILIPLAKREADIIALTSAPVAPSEVELVCRQIASQFKLSDREAEILRLLAKGNTANGIASKLVISPHTVNTHIRHIYEKVGIHKRSELLEYINMRRSDNE